MEPNDVYLLIACYLARQTTPEEAELLANWVAASPANERTFEQLKLVWEAGAGPAMPAGTTAALQRVKLQMKDHAERPAFEVPVLQLRVQKRKAYWKLVILLLLVLGGTTYWMQQARPTAYQVCRTQAGEQRTLHLPDGTVVRVAPQTVLRYPAHFAAANREVYLSGEAFFEVTKDAKRPFRVHSGSWITRVLGTRFNVSARPGAAQQAVSLVEGRVEVRDERGTYQLRPGQQLLAEHSSGRIYRQAFDEQRVTGWQRRRLQFRNEKLGEAAVEIERLYAVQLVFADTATANVRLWATFENEPLPQLLAALSRAGHLAARQEGHTIYLQLNTKSALP